MWKTLADMKTIGLIGGMTWESTMTYYKIINEEILRLLGGYNSAKCILLSVNFDEIERYQRSGEWDKCGKILNDAAKSLEKAGADFLVLCTNTMHKVEKQILEGVNIPFLHIADMTSEEILKNGIRKVGLLGTIYTMEEDFYRLRLEENGLEVMVPEKEDRDIINRVIFDELCFGKIKKESKKQYLQIIDKMIDRGIEGVILGCTEIGLLINQGDLGKNAFSLTIPVFDTTTIHAKKAAQYSVTR